MKIINTLTLSEGQTGLELKDFTTEKEKEEFFKWAKECDIEKYVNLDGFYRADFAGDIDYPAIQIVKGAPKKT